jgi:DNA-binding MarR family transcriptional regulator
MKNLSSEQVNLLRHNARSVVRELGLLNDAYYEIGVTLAERHLLIELTSCTCPTMGEIAQRLLLDKSTASRLISKAIKKGYIKYTTEQKDKRKKYIHMTELGKKTLNAFEPIAFHQTKEALLTLSENEIELVCKGVALYATGLKHARLLNKEVGRRESEEKMVSEEINTLLAQKGLTLKPFVQEDEESLYNIFQEIVESGNQVHFECSSKQEFYRQFLESGSQVFTAHLSERELVGGFTIKPNFSGRSKHVANAVYMIKRIHQGRGIGTLLVKASLEFAKQLGFRAMQFNMVLSENHIALKLYQKLGFNIIGTISRAIKNLDGSYQEGLILHRELDI